MTTMRNGNPTINANIIKKYGDELNAVLVKLSFPTYIHTKHFCQDNNIFTGHTEVNRRKILGTIVSGMPQYEKSSRSVYRRAD